MSKKVRNGNSTPKSLHLITEDALLRLLQKAAHPSFLGHR